MFILVAVFLSAAGTSSPGVDVPDASTTSLVLPTEGGLKGVGPDEEPARSQGFGGGLLPAIKKSNKFQVTPIEWRDSAVCKGIIANQLNITKQHRRKLGKWL